MNVNTGEIVALNDIDLADLKAGMFMKVHDVELDEVKEMLLAQGWSL